MFWAFEATGSARILSALMFVHCTIRSITESVKKRVKRASGLLESIESGIWLELVVRFRSIALNFGISLRGEKPEGYCFVRLSLY